MAMMNNKKFDKSQVIVLFVLLLLLIFIPLLPSSIKPTYLYFIFNVLIIALGAEAGLLSAFSHPNSEDRIVKPVLPYQSEEEAIQEPQKKEETNYNASEQNYEKKKMKVLEKSSSEKIVVADKVVECKMKKCVSVPSLFYIGGDHEEESDSEVDEEIIEEDEVVGQELFANAEAFIGNFYKQLKMQREISQRNFSRMNRMCC